MGNSLPVASPPKPSPSRAVIFMEPQCIRSYLREPWSQPGKLQIIGSTDEVPPALDGVVPIGEYRRMMTFVEDHAASFRGGRIQIGVALFQACLFTVIVFGFFLSRYLAGIIFFNPITLAILGTLELGVLFISGRTFQREEIRLKKELLGLCHPWRQEYRIVAKFRKARGRIGGDGDKKSSTFYCLLMDKMRTDDDHDTVSMSSEVTDMESEIDSQV